MITIFSVPRGFQDPDVARRQRNAVKSWLALSPKPEVILFGDDPGIAECCAELKVRHVADVAKNEYGTPYLHSIFKQAAEIAQHEIICFVNTDIILMDEFLRIVFKVAAWQSKFLVVGRRMNIDFTKDLDTANPDWKKDIAMIVSVAGEAQAPLGSDFFAFPKSIDVKMPPFVVGRPVWDNWMFYYFRRIRIPLVDISQAYMPVHQNHDYRHVLKRHANGKGHGASGPEGDVNVALLGYSDPIRFALEECTHVMDKGRQICPKEPTDNLQRREAVFKVLHPGLYKLKNGILTVAGLVGIKKVWLGPLALFGSVSTFSFLGYSLGGYRKEVLFFGPLLGMVLGLQMRFYFELNSRLFKDHEATKWRFNQYQKDIDRIVMKMAALEKVLSDSVAKNPENISDKKI